MWSVKKELYVLSELLENEADLEDLCRDEGHYTGNCDRGAGGDLYRGM